jgi:NADPH:quinone reductase-like Zn-dependent oxidoreductase
VTVGESCETSPARSKPSASWCAAGAETVIDYTQADFTSSGQTFDVIFDVAGKSSFGRCRKALKPGGIYLTTAPSPALFAQAAWTSKFGRRKAAIAFTGLRPAGREVQGPAASHRADRGRRAHRRHRGALPARADRRCAAPRGGRTKSRQPNHGDGCIQTDTMNVS